MGQSLAKPVTSVVVQRFGGEAFRAGFAEMNGWRSAMEDAHVAHLHATWGFFGVFDGHGGDQCSNFVAKRLTEELEKGRPEDDAAVKDLMLRLDSEYLERKQPGGSTGTFVIVEPPNEDRGKYLLRVGNIGDSRVLLGRLDGTMVEGSGTDGALTTDHKPNHPDERKRIERCGGSVRIKRGGVARVNGDLAVSRAFGDAFYKKTGGPNQEDRPVCAAPELTTLECGPADFVLLVCDGIFEGNFSNREIVRLAAKRLRESEKGDPASAATAVCRQALRQGSEDNLSCMMVLLGGGEIAGPATELLPGPLQLMRWSVDMPSQVSFLKAYAAMAERAGLSLEQAVELRYDVASAEVRKLQQVKGHRDRDRVEKLLSELAQFGGVVFPSSLSAFSIERTQWFSEWLDSVTIAMDFTTDRMDVTGQMGFSGNRATAEKNRLLAPKPGTFPPWKALIRGGKTEWLPSFCLGALAAPNYSRTFSTRIGFASQIAPRRCRMYFPSAYAATQVRSAAIVSGRFLFQRLRRLP